MISSCERSFALNAFIHVQNRNGVEILCSSKSDSCIVRAHGHKQLHVKPPSFLTQPKVSQINRKSAESSQWFAVIEHEPFDRRISGASRKPTNVSWALNSGIDHIYC
jgi:hypothetical protein